jgi:hypothetical protein
VDCLWCNGGCVSKYAKIYCESRIEDSESCPCANASCPVDTSCVENNGSADCVDIVIDPCEEMDDGSPICVDKLQGDPCANARCPDTCVVGSDGYAKCITNGDPCAGINCPLGYTCESGDCNPVTCTYNGVTYHHGDPIPSDDGCNQCTVICFEPQSPTVSCTEMACISPRECKTNNGCDSGYYCEKPSCDYNSQGYCKQRPVVCGN